MCDTLSLRFQPKSQVAPPPRSLQLETAGWRSPLEGWGGGAKLLGTASEEEPHALSVSSKTGNRELEATCPLQTTLEGHSLWLSGTCSLPMTPGTGQRPRGTTQAPIPDLVAKGTPFLWSSFVFSGLKGWLCGLLNRWIYLFGMQIIFHPQD